MRYPSNVTRHLVLLTIAAGSLETVFGLTCYTCNNYGTFFSKPLFDKQDCVNTAKYAEVVCPSETLFCLSVNGMIHREQGALWNATTLEHSVGTQRGCFTTEAIKVLKLQPNFLRSGGCETGTMAFTPANTTTFGGPPNPGRNLRSVHTFTGKYCLCKGDRCNTDFPEVLKSSTLTATTPSSLFVALMFSQIILIPPLANGKARNGAADNEGFIGQDEDFDRASSGPHGHDEEEWLLEQEREETVSTGEFTWPTVKAKVRNGCTFTAWRRRLPISYWLPKYSLRDFRGDLVAGLTVGLTVVPQGLAYAAIAQVPLEYGLYSAFMGCFMYTLFGTAKDITLGPTAVLSLMTAASFPKGASAIDKAHYAVLLSFFTGIAQLILGIFNLGFLINFISAPVISGFTTASAFIILYGQIKTLTGLKFDADTVIDFSVGYVKTIKSINGWDTLMGIICLGILLLMKDLALPKKPMWNIKKKTWNIYREVVRTICVTRYALVIIVATAVGYYVTIKGYKGLSITENVKGGIPKIGPPEFVWANRTNVASNIMAFAGSIPMVVLVGALESIAVAKAFGFQFQYRIDPTQELIALGLSNVLCSFFHGYPVTGSFTRSALKAQSGVRTPLGCTWTGAFVLLAMAVISPAFKYVPKAALSAVIMAAILILFEFKIFKDLWLINKKELVPILVTIIVAFTVSVDMGILSGIGVSMLLLLYPIARPTIIAHFKQSLYSLRPRHPTTGKRTIHVDVTPQGAVFFPAAEYLRDFFQDNILAKSYNEAALLSERPGASPVMLQISEIDEQIVFNGIHLTDSDYTTLRSLRSVVMSCLKANRKIRFVNTEPSVLKIVLPKEMQAKMDKGSLAQSAASPGMGVSTIQDPNCETIQLSESTAEKMAHISRNAVDAAAAIGSTFSFKTTEEMVDMEDDVNFEKQKEFKFSV
ncbi:Sodium-independent sulfate anion transporter [Hypsibius exemplaris]|uniref:Sodium-independent sulfate anion transporter n=1 Tax=Hypsibius exemplaris TaxID=2072580 RepID=A0A1W0WXI3_HYPEX|nr:Sodium-independent sulfate anion transporter [Hypsibius exemplaris]